MQFSLFILVLLLILSPFYGDGLWGYLDNAHYIQYFFTDITSVNPFLTWTLNSGFGSPEALHNLSRWFGNMLFFLSSILLGSSYLNQVALMWVYFIFIYYFSEKILLFVGLQNNFYIKLLIAFNPISIFLLNQMGHFLVYPAFLMLLFILLKILLGKKLSYFDLLIYFIGIVLIISYPRLTVLYLFLLTIIIIGVGYFRKKTYGNILSTYSIQDFSLLLFITFSANIPLLLELVMKIKNSAYTKGPLEYMDSSALLAGDYTYNFFLNLPFYKTFFPTEITSNISSLIQNSLLYIISTLFFIGIIILFTIFFGREKRKYRMLYSICFFLYLFCIFILHLPKYMDVATFINLTYFQIPIFVNNLKWIMAIGIFVLIIYITLLSLSLRNQSFQKLLNIGIIVIVCLSLSPLFFNYKIALLTRTNFEDYSFLKGKNGITNSLFLPGNYLLLENMPYPFNLDMGVFKEIFSSNTRLVSIKQSKLYEMIKQGFDPDSLKIFNLKSVLLFKKVLNPKIGQFDFFPFNDYLQESKTYYDLLNSNTDIYLQNENKIYVQYNLKDDDKYEYFLYAPATILRKDMDEFFSGGIDISQKPVNIDSIAFHLPSDIHNWEIPNENKDIILQYKQSSLQPTKIYVKIENFDPAKPFLLQLNQTFGMNWKIKWITKEQFDEKPCISDYREYEITDNKVCQYTPTILDVQDTQYLFAPEVSSNQHFEGNFVGNTWLITPSNIPDNMKNQQELYAVIIYEKQIWYNWALIISGLTFLILVALSMHEWIISKRVKDSIK